MLVNKDIDQTFFKNNTNMEGEILTEGELNHILSTLRTSPLEWVGNEEWSKQMSMLEQLNVQAAFEANQGGEERVRDAFIEAGKMPYLVHELILLELWRTQVLPELLLLGQPETSFQVYMVMFNEANVANILDTTLFAQNACEALDDSAIDLLDYACRVLSQLAGGEIQVPKANDFKEALSNWKPGQELPQFPNESIQEEIQRLQQEILFQVYLKKRYRGEASTKIIINLVFVDFHEMYFDPAVHHGSFGTHAIRRDNATDHHARRPHAFGAADQIQTLAPQGQ